MVDALLAQQGPGLMHCWHSRVLMSMEHMDLACSYPGAFHFVQLHNTS